MILDFNKINRRLRSHLFRYLLAWLPREPVTPSRKPVSLLFPLAPKDLDRAARSIPSAMALVNHEIERIYVVTPPSEDIAQFCHKIGAKHIVETDILSEDVLKFQAARKRLNGWYRQQFIKLSFPYFIQDERVITFDSDTRPVRAVTFWDAQERSIFYSSDERNANFLKPVPTLIGGNETHPYSFVSHCMGFERERMLELHRIIEKRTGLPWHKGILNCVHDDCLTGFSEFELYGNFMHQFHSDKILLKYWYNRKADLDVFMSEQAAPSNFKRFNFISSHAK
ncbi:DUF6492 family protein [Pseudovibrio sp. Ad26]|uniref:DUF6492 family protein n=1 Tax=Pseudovibrio sp. Ad26 TaxID=989410 RepID=UPI0007AE9228|nr:DUF6492 family protein [Pseudovibrio sp. Ad26]